MSGMKVASRCTSSHTKTATGRVSDGVAVRRSGCWAGASWVSGMTWTRSDCAAQGRPSLRLFPHTKIVVIPEPHTKIMVNVPPFQRVQGRLYPDPSSLELPTPILGNSTPDFFYPRLPPKPLSRGAPREVRRGRGSQLQAETARARHRRNCRRNCKRNCW